MSDPSSVLSGSILLVHTPAEGEPRIFWARRHASSSFLSGFRCFPGGRAEVEDLEAPTRGGPSEPTVRQAYVAAIRETFEEVGILIGADLGASARASSQQMAREGVPFNEMLSRLGITLDLDRLTPAGRWRTPDYAAKPFLTYFVVAEVSAPEQVTVPPGHPELEDGRWETAPEAIARWEAGELFIAPSTLWLLSAVADGALSRPDRFEAIEEARAVPPRHAQIRPGLVLFPVRTPTLPPATHTNVYIAGHEALWIFDPASPFDDARAELDAYLDARIAEGARVKGLVLTHHHHDHVGGAAYLAARLGVKIWAHEETAARVDFPVDVLIGEGDVLPCDAGDWRALHTPGHAPGHLCYLDLKTGCLVSGDMVAGVGTILVEPGDGSMSQYLASLERLRALAPSCLMPSHGPVIGGAEQKLTAYIEHRKMREGLIVRALEPSPTTLDDLLPSVYGDVPSAVWPIALLSLEAHLVKLAEDGVAARAEGGWALIQKY